MSNVGSWLVLYTERFTDLDKLNLVKFAYGGLTFNIKVILSTEAVFLVMLYELFSCFPIYLVPSWERARTQHD